MASISGIGSINTLSEIGKILNIDNDTNDDGVFGEILDGVMQKINQVNDAQIYAADLADAFARGEVDNIEQVMIAGQKADIMMQFAMAVRTKILDAYNEIMRMQI